MSQRSASKGKRQKHPSWKRARKLHKFKKGNKGITFLTYDEAYGNTNKMLNFIQWFDAPFGRQDFTKGSKLQYVAMHLQKPTQQWWASLFSQGIAPRT